MADVDKLYEQFSSKRDEVSSAGKELEDAKKTASDLEARLKQDKKKAKDLEPQLREALGAEIKDRRAILNEAGKAVKKGDYKAAHDLLKYGKVLEGMNLVFMLDSSGSMEHNYEKIAKAAKECIDNGPEDLQYGVVNFSYETFFSGFVNKDDKSLQELSVDKNQAGPTELDEKKLGDLLSRERPYALIMVTDGECQDPKQPVAFLKKVAEKGNKVAVIYCAWELSMPKYAKEVAEFGHVCVAKKAEDAVDLMKQYAAHVLRGEEKPCTKSAKKESLDPIDYSVVPGRKGVECGNMIIEKGGKVRKVLPVEKARGK